MSRTSCIDSSAERVADAAQDAREERVAEHLGGRLGDDDGDGVAAPGDQASRRAVRDVAELADGRLDRVAGRLATRRSPLTTRDAVARDTRASLATCSRVTGPLRGLRCESALTIIAAIVGRVSRERSHERPSLRHCSGRLGG